MPTNTNHKNWMKGTSPWKGAALAMLLESPGHPYGLAGRLGKRLGAAWPVKAGDLYRILENLEKYGLVEPRPSQPYPTGKAHRARKTYQATPLTAGAVDEWMTSLHSDGGPMGLELCVRIAVARPKDVPFLLGLLDVRESECLDLLKEYAKEHPDDRLFGMELELIRKYTVAQIKATLEWIEVVRGSLEEFSGSAPSSARSS